MSAILGSSVFDMGDVVYVELEIRDPQSSNTLIDPTNIVAKVKNPLGAVTQYTLADTDSLVKKSVGIYTLVFSANVEGEWYYRFETTGIGAGATERKIVVKDSAFY